MAFNIFKKKEVQEAVIYDKNLYILAEVQKQGFVNYMEANGIMVKNFSTEVNKLIFSLIREKSPIRLVIIDYGNGGFKSMDAINNIVGLVTTAAMKKTDEEDSNVTVFTKSGALTKALKDNNVVCDIREYKGASDVVKALMSYNERYITPGAKDIDGAPSADLMSYRYVKEDNKQLEQAIKNSRVSIDINNVNVMADGDSIERFNCKF